MEKNLMDGIIKKVVANTNFILVILVPIQIQIILVAHLKNMLIIACTTDKTVRYIQNGRHN